MQTVNPIPASPAPAPMTAAERDALLTQWQQAKLTLDEAKERELAMRNKIVNESGLFDPAKASGTQNVMLGNGWKLKAEKKLNWSITNKEGEAFRVMERLMEMGEASARAAKELFSWKADIRTGEYKKLTDDEKAIVDPILTIKPGTPSLELVPPKGK